MESFPRLAVVEADTMFDGRRRVRLPATSTLDAFRQSVLDALNLDCDDYRQKMEIHVFRPTTESFQVLSTVRDLPRSSVCRLRLVFVQPNASENDGRPCGSSPLSSDDGPTLLALPWKEFAVNLSDGSFQINNKPLRIQEVSNSGLGTGLNVWDGSVVLSKYLEANAEKYVIGKNILEVGAGTGLSGLAAGFLGAKRVILTDLEYSINNLKNNIQVNQASIVGENASQNKTATSFSVQARVLDWFDPEASEIWPIDGYDWDIILAADVVWIESLILPLVRTLRFICSKVAASHGYSPLILLSYQCRSKLIEELFFGALAEYSFRVVTVPVEDVKSERIQIFQIKFQTDTTKST